MPLADYPANNSVAFTHPSGRVVALCGLMPSAGLCRVEKVELAPGLWALTRNPSVI